ncbi:hypothetical protein [Rubricoccus marinus]|uniref:Uncharacterized protein n=1 Tax=Rubricoccus marinus TaxID=716817 RepID=A0A259TVY8_9BACT|nr:hypothetical protein [Rubricoccus marinus]OZC01718.1 hypothetical protein BSZ36_01195 [Rubricoccus marinus]
MHRTAYALLFALALAGCQDDPWVRLNVGANNMRWVPKRSLVTQASGAWVSATLRPQDADFFTAAPFSVLLHRDDRPDGAREDREWLTRSVTIEGVTDLDRALGFVPLVDALRTDSSGAQYLVPLADGRVRIRLERRRSSLWVYDTTVVVAPRPSGGWAEDTTAAPWLE